MRSRLLLLVFWIMVETLIYGLKKQRRLEELSAQNQILRGNAVRLEQIIGGHRDNAHQLAMRLSGGIDSNHLKEKYDISLKLGNVVESLCQENAAFTEGMLKVLEHVMRYGRQLGQCDVRNGFEAGTSNIEPPCSDFNLPQHVMDAYTMFRSTS
ncbi:hypothetical protein Tco_1149554 [Tanacetum coccineum]